MLFLGGRLQVILLFLFYGRSKSLFLEVSFLIPMDYYAARQQHLEWLKENLAQEEAKLAEAHARLIQLQGSIVYYRQAIEQLAPGDSESPASTSEHGNNSSQEDSDSRRHEHLNLIAGSTSQIETCQPLGWKIQERVPGFANYSDPEGGSKRKPRDMMRSQYKEKTLGDGIQECLEAKTGSVLGSEQITKYIFEVQSLSNEDFQRAKNSLASELRRGAKGGKWQQVGRGLFTANSDSSRQKQEVNGGNGFLGHKPLPV